MNLNKGQQLAEEELLALALAYLKPLDPLLDLALHLGQWPLPRPLGKVPESGHAADLDVDDRRLDHLEVSQPVLPRAAGALGRGPGV